MFAIYVLIVLTVVFNGSSGELTVKPKNDAVITGSNTTFECQIKPTTNSTVLWKFRGVNKLVNESVIYNGSQVSPEFKERYTVNVASPGQFDLIIKNASLSDAGIYTCEESQQPGSNASAIYTVLGHEPNCSWSGAVNDTVINDVITMTCHVLYNGTFRQRPMMAWYRDGQPMYNDSSRQISDTEVWSNISVTATPPTLNNYTCRTYFDKPKLVENETLNLSESIPTYSYNWSTPTIQVMFPPVNVTINVTWKDGSIDYNDELTCSASGYPPPAYRWVIGESGQTVDGPTLRVTWYGQQTFECRARNVIRGHTQGNVTDITLEVLLAPVNSTISGMSTDNEINVGEHLSCSSVAFPIASYTWLQVDTNTNVTTHGSTVKVTRAGKFTFNCTATNVIRGVNHTDTTSVTVHVIDTSPSGPSGSTVTAIVFVTCLGFCLLVIIVYLVCRRRRRLMSSYVRLSDDAGSRGHSHSSVA
jgi:hypothetical protein